jgi:hypothetical protein
MIVLVNPATGVRFEYEGQWQRSSPATDSDIKRGRARFRGDRVHLNLPPGVQVQLDKGILQVDTDYEARTALDRGQVQGPVMPKGNASHEVWANYAVTQGMAREESAALSRDQIRARFAEPSFDPEAAPEGLEMLNESP